MHDGSEATLALVIDVLRPGGNPNPWLDGGMRPLALTEQEKADLRGAARDLHQQRSGALRRISPKLMPKPNRRNAMSKHLTPKELERELRERSPGVGAR